MGGAVEKVWFGMGSEFARRGHQVVHISRQHSDLGREEWIEGVHHRRVPGFDAPRSVLRLKLLDLIYSLRVLRQLPPADILVTNTFWLPILVRNQNRGKLYVHVARFPKGQMRFYSHAARLQTVSRAVAEAIRQEVPALNSRIATIPYPLPEAPDAAEPIAPKKREILFVGRIHPEKGLHLLIEALVTLRHRLKDWRLVVVGPDEPRFGGGGGQYLAELKHLAEPLREQVTWTGPIFDSQKLAAVYRSASVFVYPSLADKGETFGLAPLEAMSHGCIPLVSGLRCFQDFIQPGVNGFAFDHLSPTPMERLADTLCKICEMSTGSQTSAAARETASRYTIRRIADACIADFETLLGTPRGLREEAVAGTKAQTLA